MDMIHVPYKGFGQGLADVLANQVPLIFGGITASIQLTRSGKLKALGVTGPKRSKAMPDVPAIAETLPGFDITAWYGFMAPAGTPREIIARLNGESVKALHQRSLVERLESVGLTPAPGTPEEFGRYIEGELARWAKVAKAANVRAE
jgi:tripartite-type tricarboxylate transporter receptor subunit TctC